MSIKIKEIKDVKNEILKFSKYEMTYFNFKDSYQKSWEKYYEKFQKLSFAYLEEDNNVIGILGWIYDNVESSISLKEAGYDPKDKYTWLMAIAVDKEYRGKGLSSKLMEYFIQSSKENGIELLGLRVEPSNKVAINMYEKFRFKEYNKSKNSILMSRKV